MKAHIVLPDVPSHAVSRTIAALTKHAPSSVSFVEDSHEADLVILNVIGGQDRTRMAVDRLITEGRRVAMIQYCVRSTMRPSTEGWQPLWHKASLVWSYYDLPNLCRVDGVTPDFEFYHAPLGVDAKVFKPPVRRSHKYLVCTSGQSALTESVREAIYAARRVNRKVLHLGPELKRGPDVVCQWGLSDAGLARLYGECDYVLGLRRIEGFELPAAEGLLCGSRPVVFDKAHYHQWFDGWASFIQEGPRDEVIDSLESIFKRKPKPVTRAERVAAAMLFNWNIIITGFWERLA